MRRAYTPVRDRAGKIVRIAEIDPRRLLPVPHGKGYIQVVADEPWVFVPKRDVIWGEEEPDAPPRASDTEERFVAALDEATAGAAAAVLLASQATWTKRADAALSVPERVTWADAPPESGGTAGSVRAGSRPIPVVMVPGASSDWVVRVDGDTVTTIRFTWDEPGTGKD